MQKNMDALSFTSPIDVWGGGVLKPSRSKFDESAGNLGADNDHHG